MKKCKWVAVGLLLLGMLLSGLALIAINSRTLPLASLRGARYEETWKQHFQFSGPEMHYGRYYQLVTSGDLLQKVRHETVGSSYWTVDKIQVDEPNLSLVHRTSDDGFESIEIIQTDTHTYRISYYTARQPSLSDRVILWWEQVR